MAVIASVLVEVPRAGWISLPMLAIASRRICSVRRRLELAVFTESGGLRLRALERMLAAVWRAWLTSFCSVLAFGVPVPLGESTPNSWRPLSSERLISDETLLA